jgi:hypothetical protein
MRAIRSLTGAFILVASVFATSAISPQAKDDSRSVHQPKQMSMAYTVVKRITQVQTLLDGTTITREQIETTAVDSSGRFYREMRDVTGNSSQFRVFDRTNHVDLFWSSSSNEATRNHPAPPREPVPQPRIVVTPPVSGTQGNNSNLQSDHPKRLAPEVKSESLGKRTILGMVATGSLTTTTFPVGFDGNDRPLVLTEESWHSPSFPSELIRISSDPRTGVTTTEITDIERGEPDPSLFEVPGNLAIRDIYPQ